MRGSVPPGWPWGGRWGSWSREGVLLEGPGRSLLRSSARDSERPWPLSLLQRATPFGSAGASEGEQLLILSSPQPAAEREHGHGDGVELPHLP